MNLYNRTGGDQDVAEVMHPVDRSEQLLGAAGREAQAVHDHGTPRLQHPTDGAHENSQVREIMKISSLEIIKIFKLTMDRELKKLYGLLLVKL